MSGRFFPLAAAGLRGNLLRLADWRSHKAKSDTGLASGVAFVFGCLPIDFPDREHFWPRRISNHRNSRSVKIMARHALTTAEIGDIVRSARKAAGLRQDELAGAACVGLRFVVDLEAGKPTA